MDQVTLIGEDGEDRITVEDLAELSGRFNYEFVCCLGKRIPRIYKRAGRSKRDRSLNTSDELGNTEVCDMHLVSESECE